MRAAKILFIIFIDGIFTSFVERPFTNSFDDAGTDAATACVYPPRTTD